MDSRDASMYYILMRLFYAENYTLFVRFIFCKDKNS